jgi:hypothetical protein
MSVYHRMEEERDALEEKVAELERTVRDREADVYKVIGENADLLAALEEILEGNRNGWIARVAREAIAKAKGGE